MVDCVEEVANRWKVALGSEVSREIESLGKDHDDLADAFYRDLEFGTGGLRGKLGIGPNRMNVWTVGKATQGLADYLNARYERPVVALCRDSRNGGKEFVKRAAEVFAANGITSYIYPRIEPTPALSFAVRDLGCSAGVNITASHNPAIYNGYKVYGDDGCQITVEEARSIQRCIDNTDTFQDVKLKSYEEAKREGLVREIEEDTLDRYCSSVRSQSTEISCKELSVVYTPLNGAGIECVTRVLDAIGVCGVSVVEEQAGPDGDFPTCPYPNPEIKEALVLGLEKCRTTHSDLLLATDPDADRVGVAVRHGEEYLLLSGNEVGLLLLDYLARIKLENGCNLKEKVALTTVVSTPMANEIATDYGFELRRTLTGFKFIGEQIGVLERGGSADRFLFGFEESYGYLAGTYVRDKDAVVASMLICELAAWWKKRGMDLYEAMQGLYSKYGYWASKLMSIAYDGPEGSNCMRRIMSCLRVNRPHDIAGVKVVEFVDYSSGVLMPVINETAGAVDQVLPKADVIEFNLEGGSKVLIRPSGTEPKIKAYVFARAETSNKAECVLQTVSSAVEKILS